MTSGDLILNIIVKINDGDVKVNSLNDSLKLSANQMKSVSSSTVSLSGALQNAGLRFVGLKAIVKMLSSTFGEFIKIFNEFQNATLGLVSVLKFKGIETKSSPHSGL